MEPKKYEYIDSLRGIAILLVILVHVSYLPNMTHFLPDILIKFMDNGKYGVQLFFIASAFTLVMSHQNRLGEKHATRNFFIRRVFRIAPMYYIAILYFTFECFLGFDFSNFNFEALSLKSLATNLLFINSFFPEYANGYVPGGWSVSVEFIFYLFVPFLCTRIRNLDESIIFLISALIVSTLCYYIIYQYDTTPDHAFSYFNFTAQLPVFAMGITAYWSLRDKEENIKPGILMFLAFAIFLFCYIDIPYHLLYSIMLMMLVITQSKKAYRLFSNKILARIGKVSFSMYLVHFAIVYIYRRLEISNIIDVTNTANSMVNIILIYIVIAALAYFISNITYRFVEVPGQNLGKIIIKKLDQQY